jgi:type II secretory pathway component GspD/PulD (secretin)
LGWLFKYHKKNDDKTNLFFFISPKIVRTTAEAAALTMKKNNEAGVLEEGVVRMYDSKKDKPKTAKP